MFFAPSAPSRSTRARNVVDAVKRMRTPNEAQSQRMLQQLRIEIDERGGNVDVRTIHPPGSRAFARSRAALRRPLPFCRQ